MEKEAGDKKAGVGGLAIRGGAMAANRGASGWEGHGYDPDGRAREAAAASGVAVHDGLTALVHAVPVLMTSLPTPSALHASAAAIAAAGASRRIVVEASTMALDDKLRFGATLEAAGHVPLDCPISGTGAQARTRDLVIYASGDPDAVAAVQPFFAGFARAAHDLGAYGNGSRMKYVANLLVAIHNVASAEAMVLGMKAGLDPRQVVELVGAGVGTSRVFELRAPMMAAGTYEPATMKVSVWQKDMAIIGEYASALGVPTPLLSACIPVYASAMALGHGPHDTAAVCDVLERMAAVER